MVLPSGVGSGLSGGVGVVDLPFEVAGVVSSVVDSVSREGVVEDLILSGGKVVLKLGLNLSATLRTVLGLNLSPGLLVGNLGLLGLSGNLVVAGVVGIVVEGVVNTAGGSLRLLSRSMSSPDPGSRPGLLISTTSRSLVAPSLLTADIVTALGAKVEISKEFGWFWSWSWS